MQAVLTYFTIIMTSMFMNEDGTVIMEASVTERTSDHYELIKENQNCEEYAETIYKELKISKSNINL